MPVKAGRRSTRKRVRRRSRIVKRAILVFGRGTGVSLEDAFWDAMQKIAMAKGTTRARLIGQSKRSASPRTCPQRFVYSCSRTIRLTHGDETSEPARPADDARQETRAGRARLGFPDQLAPGISFDDVNCVTPASLHSD